GVTSAAPAVAQDVPAVSLPSAGNVLDLEPAAVVAAPSEATAPDVQGIVLAFNPSGPGRCEVNISPWPADAKAAVTRAAAIWSSLLNGSQPIVIDVCWSPDFAANGLLANCGSRTGTFADFVGAPLANTNYPLPLANQLSNSDLNGGDPEMQCRFNANRPDWYMGLDGIVPASRFDLISTALHEIGHGLGFAGGVAWDDGNAPNECNGTSGVGCYATTPDVYDRFVQTSNGTSILSLANNSMALGSALTGDALVFAGSNAIAANGGAAPRLHAPATWVAGASYQHLREDTFTGVATGLMTPAMPAGTAIHHPGAVALGMLKDMGWTIYDLSITYVDKSNAGLENGGVLHPFNTAIEGVSAVPFGGRVFFFAGNYQENLTISRPMTLESIQGVVRIGQ
ncbi:MAG: hypothetical protein KDE24_26970, partial [Caldilinea sp.]|nr:hypothetical protein [Caldilinea sp.]